MMTQPPNTFLKTRQVARALGVSVSTIKRWVDSGALRATRTVGKHRLIARDEAERFAREQGLRWEALAQEADGLPPIASVDEQLVDCLAVALRRGRSREAREMILGAFASAGAVALGDDLIRPVMQRIGHEWEVSSIDIYQEHRATRVVTHALMEIVQQQQLRSPDVDAPLALGAAPEGDPYVLPGLLCEIALREQGWDVMNLGVNLPMASLAKAVRAHRPRLTWISISHLMDEVGFLREYAAFYGSASATGTAVVVGGQALHPECRAKLLAASFGDRIAHLNEFARRVRPDIEAPTDRSSPERPT